MNPDCPACQQKRRHTAEEWKQFHPLSRHGFVKGQGFSSEEARIDLRMAEKFSSEVSE